MQPEPRKEEQAEQSARADSAGAESIFIFEHSRQEATDSEKRMNQLIFFPLTYIYEWLIFL